MELGESTGISPCFFSQLHVSLQLRRVFPKTHWPARAEQHKMHAEARQLLWEVTPWGSRDTERESTSGPTGGSEDGSRGQPEEARNGRAAGFCSTEEREKKASPRMLSEVPPKLQSLVWK